MSDLAELIELLKSAGHDTDGPRFIWLEPNCAPERTWCEDDVYERCECGARPVRYVRLDVALRALQEKGQG